MTTRDAVAQNYTEADLQQLVSELRQRQPDNFQTFRLSSFICERQQERIPEELRRAAADNLASFLVTSGQQGLGDAAEIFIAWGAHRADYHTICVSLLDHPDVEVREKALTYVASYLQAHEFPILCKFRQDPYIGETGGMGGPLRFILRDYALKVLKWLTNAPDDEEDDCFESTPEGQVSYRSWSAFLNWYEAHKAPEVSRSQSEDEVLSWRKLVPIVVSLGFLGWILHARNMGIADQNESSEAKREWGLLQSLEADCRGLAISGVEFTNVDSFKLISLPSLSGKRLWVMLNPLSTPYYKQMPPGEYVLSRQDFERVVRQEHPILPVQESLSSHIPLHP